LIFFWPLSGDFFFFKGIWKKKLFWPKFFDPFSPKFSFNFKSDGFFFFPKAVPNRKRGFKKSWGLGKTGGGTKKGGFISWGGVFLCFLREVYFKGGGLFFFTKICPLNGKKTQLALGFVCKKDWGPGGPNWDFFFFFHSERGGGKKKPTLFS